MIIGILTAIALLSYMSSRDGVNKAVLRSWHRGVVLHGRAVCGRQLRGSARATRPRVHSEFRG